MQHTRLLAQLLLLLVPGFLHGQVGGFTRQDTISVPVTENTGLGNFISGVDFDRDGNVEIYAVNNMWDVGGAELIPRIYKFEKHGSRWDSVWSATMNIPLQNTWPPLTWGDWDNDGKPEVIWGPANNLNVNTNPNPPRIIVFEYPGDGSDNMGVPDGIGGWGPNTAWPIVTQTMFELRPFRWFLTDIDRDGTKELIFASRRENHRYGVVEVSEIPDGGPAFELWTLVSSGLDFPPTAIDPGTLYDLAIIDSTIYLIHENGNVTPVKYANGTWSVRPIQQQVVPGGSWKSSQVVDINNDGVKEIVVGGWQLGAGGDQQVFLLEQRADTLFRTTIANLASLIGTAGRLNGSAVGDIDADGKLDFVFGGRATTPNAGIIRFSYVGGGIRNTTSYAASLIDTAFGTNPRNWDVINIANLDSNPGDEVVYSGGLDGRIPMIILKNTLVSVEYDPQRVPVTFTLEQNYPNPFNASTVIRFALKHPSETRLKVFSLLGQEVATLLDANLGAGTYIVNFNAENLSSGTYIYTLTSNGQHMSKKMILLR